MDGVEKKLQFSVVAPQDGKVFQRSVHTIGGVIQAGEAVMLIVPDGDALTVEAKIAPHEIDQVHMGQRAVLRFTAFNQRTTPELNGEVVRIGADVTQEEKKNETYYAVRIRVSDGELARLEGLKPVAGMPVEAFIQTSPRTVSYLVKPMRNRSPGLGAAVYMPPPTVAFQIPSSHRRMPPVIPASLEAMRTLSGTVTVMLLALPPPRYSTS